MERMRAVQEEGQKDTEELEAAQQHFKAVSAGLSANEDGEAATLAGQMMTCKNDMSKAETEATQVTFSPEHVGRIVYRRILLLINYAFVSHSGSNEAKACSTRAEKQAGSGEEDGQRI